MRNIPYPFLSEETLNFIARESEVEARRKRAFANIHIRRSEIEDSWSEIQQHKWFLSERLGRDVGTSVAAIDYLDNIARITRNENFRRNLQTQIERVFAGVERVIDGEGVRAFSNMQRILRGVPNLPDSGYTKAAKTTVQASSIRVTRDVITKHAAQIEHHKWHLSERLGRDVGTRVAAVDYFENVSPADSKMPVLSRLAGLLDKMMECSGPNSIANLERAMRARAYGMHSAR